MPVIDPIITTVRFDAGSSASWFLVPPLTDSGDNLRDKVVKAVTITGKMTDPTFDIYAYQPGDEIDVAVIEAGTGSQSGTKTLASSTQVTRYPRKQINVPNAELSTIRLAGEWTGGMKDRIDQIVIEVASQGIRR